MSRYRFIPERSRLWIDARSSVHPIHSESDGLEGYVDVEFVDSAVDLTASTSARLTFPVSRLKSGSRMEDRELARRIDADRHPYIEGVLDSIEGADGDSRYKVRGEVTFRGVARSHEDVMRIVTTDTTTIELDGTSRFDVRDFGMEPPRMLMLRVEPEVDVRVHIHAQKEA